MRRVEVVAAALIDADDRVLVAQRPAGKSFAGLWEFPGGKVEPGEAPLAALARELDEELGIGVALADLQPLTAIEHPYDDFVLAMRVWHCRRWAGVPRGREGQALLWRDLAGLALLPMPPADLPVLAALRLHIV